MPFAVASAFCAIAALAVLALHRTQIVLPSRGVGRVPGLLPRELARILCAGVAWGVFNAGYVVYLSFGPGMLERHGMSTLAAATVIGVGSWLMILPGARLAASLLFGLVGMAPAGAILFGAGLFALVLPAALLSRTLKAGAVVARLHENP